MTTTDREWPGSCARCGADLGKTASTMSFFNLDVICVACKEDERHAPGFTAARNAEQAAVKRGEDNFPGIGLSTADQEFLAARRAARS